MKAVTLHHISLQFDIPSRDNRKPEDLIPAWLDQFTSVLQEHFPTSSPVLMLDSEDFRYDDDATIDDLS